MNISGRDIDSNAGWTFQDSAGDAIEAAGPDDSGWRVMRLPHDWSIGDIPGGHAGPFDREAVGGIATGYMVGGEGWHRKRFRMAPPPAGGRVEGAGARNSPSVIMWSFGNEIPDRSTPEGGEWCRNLANLANLVRTPAPGRPVTAAPNGVRGKHAGAGGRGGAQAGWKGG